MKLARRGVAAASAILLALASSGCATTSDDSKKAFAEAGRQVRRQQPPPTNRELLEEVDRYIADDLAFTQEKARTGEQKVGQHLEAGRHRRRRRRGGGADVGEPEREQRGGSSGGVGAAAGALGLVEYYVQTGKMHGCQAYVAERSGILRGWANRKLKETDDPVSPEVWREWVDQTAEIEAYPKCLAVR